MTYEEKLCEYESLKQQLKTESDMGKLFYAVELGLIVVIMLIMML